MQKVLSASLIIVGIINFLPVLGLISNRQLESAYAITIGSSDLSILMRHRALLFGLIGGFTILSAFIERFQDAAIVLAGISMIGFVVLAYTTGGYNSSISRIVLVDWVGIVVLALAVFLKYFYLKQ